MAIRLFISFDYDYDSALKDFLVGQAKNSGSPFEFADASVKAHLTGDWKQKVRGRISRADQVAVICGKHTDRAAGVAAEIEIARDLKKPYFLLAGYSDGGNKKPTTALATDKVYRWSWDNLRVLIAGGR
jgi:hypothetical protein